MNPEEIQERLNPEHLSVSEMAERAEVAQKPQDDQAKPEIKDDPRDQRSYTFQFDWKDSRGQTWKGEFTNEVLSVRQRQLVGVLRAQLANNTPAEALDTMTRELNLMIAHMTFSLTKRPQWARELSELTDIRLLQALYEEVLAHEARFLGLIEASSEG
jgi:hypothetical protein